MNPRRRSQQGGFTLVELLVVMIVGGAVAAIALSGFTSGLGALARADDDARGQADVTVTAERLARDLRQARAVGAGSGASAVSLWVDADGDSVQSAAESVSWTATALPGTAQVRLVRLDGTGTRSEVTTSLVTTSLFTYDTAIVTDAQVVTATLLYDAVAGRYATPKRLVLETRLRNAR